MSFWMCAARTGLSDFVEVDSACGATWNISFKHATRWLCYIFNGFQCVNERARPVWLQFQRLEGCDFLTLYFVGVELLCVIEI